MALFIPTRNGRDFVVDDDFFQPRRVSRKDGSSAVVDPFGMSWRWIGTGSKRHAAANVAVGGRNWLVYAHRFVVECPPHMQVDHIDLDTSNNQRSNLRLATHGQNLANQAKPRRRLCDFKGVRSPLKTRLSPRPYVAAVKRDGKEYRSIGFATQEEAAREYDRMAISLYGEFAQLNFPVAQSCGDPS